MYIMQVLHGIGPARLSNTDISDFSFSSADAKAILKNHILMSQKWVILVSGISTGIVLIFMKFI